MSDETVYINCAFVDQRVSGQQRYAHEVVSRLPGDWIRLAPSGVWKRSALLAWMWTVVVLPWVSRRGVLLSLTSRAPLWHPRHVVTVHDLFVLDHPEWYSPGYVATHAPLLRRQLRTAHRVVTVSEPVSDQIAALQGTRPVVAPNAPSEVFRRVGRCTDAVVPPDGLVPGRYFLVVGNLEPRKNLTTLAAAYARLSEAERRTWPLVVVGAGADIYRESRIDWPDGTRVAGYVPDTELADLYAASGAAVLASLDEGFGLPVVEAAAAGAPRLLVADIPVFRWICADEATYVEPLATDAWERALLQVMRGEGPRCSTHLADRFTWAASAGNISSILAPGTRVPDAPARPAPGATPANVAVVVATAGRSEVTGELLMHLEKQTHRHDVILAVPDHASLPHGVAADDARVVMARRGLCAQRNAGLRAASERGAEFVVMFDDDAVPRPDYIERLVEHFEAHPDVVAATGTVLLDGAATEHAVDLATAETALEESWSAGTRAWTDSRELYGCNFAFRTAGVGDETFDERLPAYGWLEDHDFARRALHYGRLHRVAACVAVHRGVKSGGRQAHARLGYSQVMNPWYLWRKGSFPFWLMLHETLRLGKNLTGAVGTGPEHQARRRRLRGNLLALGDIGRGRLSPERMLEIE